jgi:hypothetical protein
MQIICSWCRAEGRVGLLGEKAPLEDRRETHSICLEHEEVVRVRWIARKRCVNALRTSGDSLRVSPPYIRRVMRSVLRLYVGLKGLAPKIRV